MMKNHNKFLAVIFCAAAALLSAFEFIYIGQMYSVRTGAFVLDFSAGLIFAAAISLVVGAAGAVRNAVIASEVFFLSGAVMFSVEGLFYTSMKYIAVLHLVNIMLSLVIVVAAVLTLFYTLGKFKHKYAVAAFLALSWIMCIIKMFSSVSLGELYLSAALLISGFLLIVLYPDISNENKKVCMPEIMVLIPATFGIYFILWVWSIVKKTNALTDRTGAVKYTAMIAFLAPYRPYWYYTLYEELSEKTEIKNRGILCAALSAAGIIISALCLSNGSGTLLLAAAAGAGIGLCALALLQRDLNSICPEEKEVCEVSETAAPDEVTEKEADLCDVEETRESGADISDIDENTENTASVSFESRDI